MLRLVDNQDTEWRASQFEYDLMRTSSHLNPSYNINDSITISSISVHCPLCSTHECGDCNRHRKPTHLALDLLKGCQIGAINHRLYQTMMTSSASTRHHSRKSVLSSSQFNLMESNQRAKWSRFIAPEAVFAFIALFIQVVEGEHQTCRLLRDRCHAWKRLVRRCESRHAHRDQRWIRYEIFVQEAGRDGLYSIILIDFW